MNVSNAVTSTVKITSAPEAAEWEVHGAAGLEGQLLIAVTATETLEVSAG